MNRSELQQYVADETGLTGADSERAINAVTEAITASLERGDKVALAGFGTFETRQRAARSGRNPQTGEAIEIAASTSAAFKPAAALKRRLGGS